MRKLIEIIFGCILCSISLTVLIIYISLFSYGYNFIYFFKSLIKNLEIYLFIPGIYLIIKK